MRAATVSRFGGPDVVEITEVPMPEPDSGQIRIKVAAAALNPVDVGIRSGEFGGGNERLGLGWDVAGTVHALGEGAGWSIGDRVIGLATGHRKPIGTHAEYVVLDVDAVAAAPATLDDVHAAALSLNALSAAQALDILALRPGQRLLITGAAGAFGGHAVELASREGLKVTALASGTDEEFLRSRGADDFLQRGELPAPGTMDGALDAALLGPDALAAVRAGGSYVGAVPGLEPMPERGIRVDALSVKQDGARLGRLARLADEGRLVVRVARTYSLDEAAAAHAALAQGGLRGRIVLIP